MNDSNAKEREKAKLIDYDDLRKAAECHRQVRRYAQTIVRPDKKYIDVCREIEESIRTVISANKIDAGISFPTGCSYNNIAAHYTPNPGDTKVIKKDEVIKIDIGTHVKGLLIDSAFTVCFDPVFDNLLLASKEATMTGIKLSGIDARFSDIGTAIQEVMDSYELELNGKVYKIRPVRNLCGHQIGRYHVFIIRFMQERVYQL